MLETITNSIQEIDSKLKDITEHFLYSEESTKRALYALSQDAIAHSDNLEPDLDHNQTLERLKEAWTWGSENFQGELDFDFIKSLSRLIDPNNEGFRKNNVKIKGRTQTYLMLNYSKIERELGALTAMTNDKSTHPILRSVETHLYYAIIHPFNDGNGRNARTLQNLLLAYHNFPPAIIRSTERETYLNQIENAGIGFRERQGQENMFSNHSYQELCFFHYIIDKIKENTINLYDTIASQKKYLLECKGKREIAATYYIKKILQSGLDKTGTLYQVSIKDHQNQTLEIISTAPEEYLIGILEKSKQQKPKLIKKYQLTQIN